MITTRTFAAITGACRHQISFSRLINFSTAISKRLVDFVIMWLVILFKLRPYVVCVL